MTVPFTPLDLDAMEVGASAGLATAADVRELVAELRVSRTTIEELRALLMRALDIHGNDYDELVASDSPSAAERHEEAEERWLAEVAVVLSQYEKAAGT